MPKITTLPDETEHHDFIDDDGYSTLTEDNDYGVDDANMNGKETFLYRVSMLRGMIPLRLRVFWHKYTHITGIWGPWIFKKIGNIFWILITSAFLVGFPIFYESERDKHLRLVEKEQRMLMPGASDAK